MKTIIAVLFVSVASPVFGATCDELAKASLKNATITTAELVAAGAFKPPMSPQAEAPAAAAAGTGAGARVYAGVPAFCRVAATLAPSNDSDIKIEVWLPAAGWNGKFQGVGNGGWAGTISYPALAAAVTAGYAAVSTDTGHVGGTAAFALDHPEKMVDFGYRAIHEMTTTGKAVTKEFYGKMPSAAIFNGCSLGGRQAITEAMRYPEDYNGIIAGAPAIYNTELHAGRAALNAMVHRSSDAFIPAAKYAAVHEAVLNACDGLDGVKDGVIDNPLACTFDFKAAQCTGADDGKSCLTPAQVETMRRLYSSPFTEAQVKGSPAYLQPGTELGWGTLAGERPVGTALEQMKFVVFKNANWDPKTFNLATDTDRALKADPQNITGLTDTNLKPYFDRGGKLLMYHGFQDPQVPAQNAIRYFNEVKKTMGAGVAGKSIQLYMLPGVNHCAGGPGPDQFDKVGSMEAWMSSGQSPASIVASHLTQGKVDRTRPLCPFGQTAKWKGTGSSDEAANFSCVAQ